MAPAFFRFAIVGLALAWTGSTLAQTEAPAPAPAKAQGSSSQETPGLRATQVAIVLGKKGKRRKFQATVMSRKDDLLTILTVAHGITAADTNEPALLLLPDSEVIEGTVVSVAQNPAYRVFNGREITGADNAVARLRFNPSSKAAIKAFEAIRPAVALTSRIYPGPAGQIVNVRIIDQKGVEHAVKAGNYSNPKLLEWGPSFKPNPGDSGSGVFVLNGVTNGQPRPILIGIITSRDDNGGMASLVAKEMRWIAEELER